jgi:TIGR03009 family protein
MHARSVVVLALLALAVLWEGAHVAQAQSAPRNSNPAVRQPVRTATNPATQYPPAGGPAQSTATRTKPAAAPPAVPQAPFVLTEPQLKLLDQVLQKWEQQSSRVKTFVCRFTRYEVDPTFGPKESNYTLTRSTGEIVYKSPDLGEYEINHIERWDQKKQSYMTDNLAIEHWMCDGDSIYEWDHRAKQLKVTPLPQGMKGKSIADGPLPFVFGAKAAELKRRYWMRDVTRSDRVGTEIWLEARPKFQQDAANFQRATIVLDERTFLPTALQLILPGIVVKEDEAQAHTALVFQSPSVNNPLNTLIGKFMAPRTPPFWKRVDINPSEVNPAGGEPPLSPPVQAERPVSGQRKQ